MLNSNKSFLPTPEPISPSFSIGIALVKNMSAAAIILDSLSYAWGWGNNTGGALADNSLTARSSPVSMVGGRQWVSINGGPTGMALDSLSYAWCWGRNVSGTVGDNSVTVRSSPVSVVGGRQWIAFSTGETHQVALDSLSYAYCWGNDNTSELGRGGAGDRSSPTSVTGGRQWIKIFAGSCHTFALDSLSYAWTWGCNLGSQLGDGTASNRNSPVSVLGAKQWIMLSCGGTTDAAGHSAGIDNLSYAWCWGLGTNGQLGNDGSSTNSPVSVVGGLQFVYISAGRAYTAAIDTSGRIWTWGQNVTGQLGDNTITQRTSPVRVATIPGATKFIQVTCISGTAGGTTTGSMLALDQDNNLWGWGNNSTAELGFINNIIMRSSPVFNPQRGPRVRNILGKKT